MTRYARKSSRFFKFLKFQKIKNVTVECDYCNYAGFGNDYRYIGTVDGSSDNTIRAWDLDTNEYITALQGHTGGVSCRIVHNNILYSGRHPCVESRLRMYEV